MLCYSLTLPHAHRVQLAFGVDWTTSLATQLLGSPFQDDISPSFAEYHPKYWDEGRIVDDLNIEDPGDNQLLPNWIKLLNGLTYDLHGCFCESPGLQIR